jgi:hypothetical protein
MDDLGKRKDKEKFMKFNKFFILLENNDLEYREERKESIQPIKKHIPLKLKSTSSSSSNNKPLCTTITSPSLQDDVVQKLNYQGPSLNKIARLSFSTDIDERLDGKKINFKNKILDIFFFKVDLVDDLKIKNKKEPIQNHKVEKLNWNFKVFFSFFLLLLIF